MDFYALLEVKRRELGVCSAKLEAELESVRARHEPELEQLKTDVAALERVIAMTSRKTETVNPATLYQKPTPKRWGKLVEGVRKVVKEIPPPITIQEVRDRLDPSLYQNPNSILGTLRKMSEDGELILVEKGGPGRGSTYRLP